MEIKTIKEAIAQMNIKKDVQFEESDRRGYKWMCPDNEYENAFKVRGDEWQSGWVYFKRDKDVIEYVNRILFL